MFVGDDFVKFKIVNTKKIIYVLLSGFVIISMTGCSKTDSSLNNSYNQSNEVITESNKSDNSIIDKSAETNNENSQNADTSNNETKNNDTSNNVTTYSNKDKTAIQTFNNLNDEIDNILKNENVESAKDKAKGTFITIVDFIFYDSEINGVTFDELTDSGKQKVLEIANKIDTKIENKFPNYKDTISDTAKEAFNKASELIKKGSYNLSKFSKEKLGEDNYNAIINAKDEFIDYTKQAIDIIGDVGSSVFESGKEYIKNWYENLKK